MSNSRSGANRSLVQINNGKHDMKLFASQLKIRAKIRDLDTDRDIRGVIWVDEQVGQCEAYVLDYLGRKQLTFDTDGAAAWKTVTLKGRFKLIPVTEPAPTKATDKIKMGAPNCARCRSPLTLRGDDLCPRCKAKDRGRPIKREKLGPFDLHKCGRCSRDAEYSVSDEVTTTPHLGKVVGGGNVRGGAYLFDTAATVGRRYFCAFHFQGPRLLDDKGEVIQIDDSPLHPDLSK